MACILLVDPSDVARRAMQGMLDRGGHRLAMVETAREAWDFVGVNVRVDLVITELKLTGGSGLALLQRLKADPILKRVPVVVYTGSGDRESVRQALALKAQNILLKPYHDEVIYGEIAKATANPWRSQHFEEEATFCQLMGFAPAELRRMWQQLGEELGRERGLLARCAEAGGVGTPMERLRSLAEQAEAAGAWGVVEYLADLTRLADANNWPDFAARLDGCAVAEALIRQQLDPALLPEPFQTRHEAALLGESRARAVWFDAPAEGRCPLTDLARLQSEVDALPGCPVIESTVAAFQMTATGHPSTLNPLMDLTARDPGLAAQVLIAAGQVKRHGDEEAFRLEDPRQAVGRLGEVRLAALARQLVPLEEKYLNLAPHFTWPQFWVFQMGVARVARFTCQYLELPLLELPARMAGLLHDLGKLLLVKLHPFAFQAALAHAREHQVPLSQAERLFLGCTTQELAAHFGEKRNLPESYVSVMRWVGRPEEAVHHRQLVAIVSLGRDLCRHYKVGFAGDPLLGPAVPLAETAEWRVLREHVFPSFNLGKFEQDVRAYSRDLRLELQGHLKQYTAA